MPIYDAYCRVSDTHGQDDGISAPDQLRKIEQWVERHPNIQLGLRPEDGMPFTDLDVSGGTMGRPELNRVLARIADGTSQGIIVAYISRFGRTSEASAVIERIEQAHGQVVAVEQDFDTTTSAGRFARDMMIGLAKMELENIRAGWNTARRQAINRGVYTGPSVPLGYRQNEDRALAIDEDASQHIWRAFDVSGAYGLQAAHEYLRESFPERVWTVAVAQKLLANRIYLGELRSGEYMKLFPELAIVSLVEWDRAQHKRAITRRSNLAPDFPLAGIATCASCGRGLVASVRQNAARRYRCANPKCSQRAFPQADELERYVLDHVRRNPPTLNDEETAQREADVAAASAALEAHATRRDAYEALDDLARWEELGEGLARQLDVARVKAMPDQFAPLPDLDREDLTPGDLRFVFERAVASCTVAPGRAPVAERVAVFVRA